MNNLDRYKEVKQLFAKNFMSEGTLQGPDGSPPSFFEGDGKVHESQSS